MNYSRWLLVELLAIEKECGPFADGQLSIICCQLLVYQLSVGERGNARLRVADWRLPMVYHWLLSLRTIQVNARWLEYFRRSFFGSLK